LASVPDDLTSPLREDERDLLGYLNGRRDELLDFARTLVQIPSVNPPGDERDMAERIVQRFDEYDVTARIVGPSPARASVIARLPGIVGGPTLAFSGHLDTKPVGDLAEWACDPFEGRVSDGRLVGLGAADMKAALAALVYAVAAVKEVGSRSGDLAVVLTADEEAGSLKGASWLAERGLLRADAAVIAEPSGVEQDWEGIHVVSRGAALFRITVLGEQLHSSLTDRFGATNATVMMSHLISWLDERLRRSIRYRTHPLAPGGPTINLGVTCRGGVSLGVNPGHAEFQSDIRTLPGMTRQEMEADLRAALRDASKRYPRLRAELELEAWVDAAEISPSERVVKAVESAAASVLGRVPALSASPGGTDACHFIGAGIPTIPAFGPGRIIDSHRPNESINIDAIAEASRIYALTAWRYLNS
jgi:acetylornithine deacetylase/succinyl-diaminopimelate desuccinylase family protein